LSQMQPPFYLAWQPSWGSASTTQPMLLHPCLSCIIRAVLEEAWDLTLDENHSYINALFQVEVARGVQILALEVVLGEARLR
jgi:hypothetical protein